MRVKLSKIICYTTLGDDYVLIAFNKAVPHLHLKVTDFHVFGKAGFKHIFCPVFDLPDKIFPLIRLQPCAIEVVTGKQLKPDFGILYPNHSLTAGKKDETESPSWYNTDVSRSVINPTIKNIALSCLVSSLNRPRATDDRLRAKRRLGAGSPRSSTTAWTSACSSSFVEARTRCSTTGPSSAGPRAIARSSPTRRSRSCKLPSS